MSHKDKKIFFFFLSFFVAVLPVSATGIGVVPNSLEFNDLSARSFRIRNPNPFEIKFDVENDHFIIEPMKGSILPGAEKSISVIPKDKIELSDTDSIILVETSPVGDVKDVVGMLPAVGVKVKIASQDLRIPKTEDLDKDLFVDDPIFKRWHIVMIALLVIAIIGVTLYPYTKKEKNTPGKKKSQPKNKRQMEKILKKTGIRLRI